MQHINTPESSAQNVQLDHHEALRSRSWQRTTRWLHALLAIGITVQLLLSLVMARPDHLQHAGQFAKSTLQTHEYFGLVTFVILLAHWVWLLLKQSDLSFAHLFPWSAAGIRQIREDLQHAWQHRKLPLSDENGGLSGLIHGLGILTATAMVGSGVALYLVQQYGSGVNSSLFHTLGDVHSAIGSLMWTYLIGHVLAASWHEYRGERIIGAMFRP